MPRGMRMHSSIQNCMCISMAGPCMRILPWLLAELCTCGPTGLHLCSTPCSQGELHRHGLAAGLHLHNLLYPSCETIGSCMPIWGRLGMSAARVPTSSLGPSHGAACWPRHHRPALSHVPGAEDPCFRRPLPENCC